MQFYLLDTSLFLMVANPPRLDSLVKSTFQFSQLDPYPSWWVPSIIKWLKFSPHLVSIFPKLLWYLWDPMCIALALTPCVCRLTSPMSGTIALNIHGTKARWRLFLQRCSEVQRGLERWGDGDLMEVNGTPHETISSYHGFEMIMIGI